jgi:hypothetical protein
MSTLSTAPQIYDVAGHDHGRFALDALAALALLLLLASLPILLLALAGAAEPSANASVAPSAAKHAVVRRQTPIASMGYTSKGLDPVPPAEGSGPDR